MEIAEIVRDGFVRWLLGLCTYREESWNVLPRLHNSYSLWSLKESTPYCRLRVFEDLLRAEGVKIERALVYGLTLVADLDDEETLMPLEEPPLTKRAITAAQWLLDALRFGPRSVIDLQRESAESHFRWTTITHARSELGIVSPVPGVWRLLREDELLGGPRRVTASIPAPQMPLAQRATLRVDAQPIPPAAGPVWAQYLGHDCD